MNKIRILLADDHAVLRAGLRMMLGSQTDMEVVGEAADGEEALQRIREALPDIAIIDITMPGLGGLQVVRRIKDDFPDTKVVMLTVHDDEAYLFKALRVGAAGYVPKKAADTELLTAIRAVHKGEVFVHFSMTKLLVGDLFHGGKAAEASKNAGQRLSGREREVLRLIAMGYTNQQVADRLYLSVKTVETYKARLVEKLELKGRADLVRYALEEGILTAES
jgi:DNA-binding NarL/FixJ family response regulator